MDKHTILKNHIEFKKTSVSSKTKIQDIERYLKLFINFSKKPLKNYTEEDLTKFINSLTKKYSIRTINDIKIYVKVFIKWFFVDYSSRFRNLEKLCRQQTPSKAYEPEQMLKEEEVKKIIASEKDMMYKVFWIVYFYGGFRPSECCNLKWSNVFFEKEGAVIKLHATKTNKDFYKGLPREAEHLLKQWREHNDSEFIFPSPVNEGKTIRARSICARLKRLSKKAIGKEVVPYAMRHSIATILYQDDKRKDDDTANQMGHSKSMKKTYLNLDKDKLKARARNLWIKEKPLTPNERNRLEDLEKEIKILKHFIKEEVVPFLKYVKGGE